MKQALTWISGLLLVVAVAAGCANADASQKPASPAQLRASVKVLEHVRSVGFHVTLNLTVDGQPTGAGTSLAGLGSKPITLQIDGHIAKHGQSAVMDATFQATDSMIPINGELRSVGGQVYVKLPLLFGEHWKRYTIPTHSEQATPAVPARAKQFDPLSVLANVTQAKSGGTRTLSADVDPAKLVGAIESLATNSRDINASRLHALGSAINVAHGSVSVDTTTHLPTAVSAEVTVTTPPKMVSQAMGITGFDLTVDASFDSWNQPVNVLAPSGATVLRLSPDALRMDGGSTKLNAGSLLSGLS